MPPILAKDRKKNMAFARAYILKHGVSNRQAERETGLGKLPRAIVGKHSPHLVFSLLHY